MQKSQVQKGKRYNNKILNVVRYLLNADSMDAIRRTQYAIRYKLMERRRTNGRFEVVEARLKNAADAKQAKQPFYERGFWVLAAGVLLIAVVVRLFDFTLWPVSYKGLYITQPFDGLHSWHFTNQYWAAHSK